MPTDESDMDIGGVNRIKPGAAAPLSAELRRNGNANTERDAQGNTGYEQRKRAKHLTPEQEQEALNVLNALPAFAKLSLKAGLVKEEGKAPHIVVRDPTGRVVRNIPYDEMIEIYANRHSGSEKGQLIRRAA